jgi:hypothetical protein
VSRQLNRQALNRRAILICPYGAGLATVKAFNNRSESPRGLSIARNVTAGRDAAQAEACSSCLGIAVRQA